MLAKGRIYNLYTRPFITATEARGQLLVGAIQMRGSASADTTHEYDQVPINSPHDSTLVTVDSCHDDAKVEQKCSSKREANKQAKLKFLNGLRGVACLMVVHHHAYYLHEGTLGATGVDIFFVLSAFLLTMLNESKIHKLVTCKHGVRQWSIVLLDYFAKRVLRVYPLFATLALLLACLSDETRHRYYNIDIGKWSLPCFLAFECRYYLFWTIPVEISYYFIIPVFLTGICLLGKFKSVAVALLYVWVYYEGSHMDRTNHSAFRPHLSTFMAGSLAAVVYSELSKWMKQTRFDPKVWHLAVIRAFEFIMLAVIVSDTSHGLLVRWFHGSLFPSQHDKVPFVSLPISAVIVIEALAPTAISRALEWNVFCFSGKVSFSMYLLHPFVNFLPWLSALPRIDQFVVRLVLVYSLSTASYFVFERNYQRLAVFIGKRLSSYA